MACPARPLPVRRLEPNRRPDGGRHAHAALLRWHGRVRRWASRCAARPQPRDPVLRFRRGGHPGPLRGRTRSRRWDPELPGHVRHQRTWRQHDHPIRPARVPSDRRQRRGLCRQRGHGRQLRRRCAPRIERLVHVRGDRPGNRQPDRFAGGTDATPRLCLSGASRALARSGTCQAATRGADGALRARGGGSRPGNGDHLRDRGRRVRPGQRVLSVPAQQPVEPVCRGHVADPGRVQSAYSCPRSSGRLRPRDDGVQRHLDQHRQSQSAWFERQHGVRERLRGGCCRSSTASRGSSTRTAASSSCRPVAAG